MLNNSFKSVEHLFKFTHVCSITIGILIQTCAESIVLLSLNIQQTNDFCFFRFRLINDHGHKFVMYIYLNNLTHVRRMREREREGADKRAKKVRVQSKLYFNAYVIVFW